MAILDGIRHWLHLERKSDDRESWLLARDGYSQLASSLGSGRTYTGTTVTEYTALNCATVWACTRVISETVAALPLHLYRRTDEGRVPYPGPLQDALQFEPNPEMDAMTLREMLTAHVATWGNAYARIVRRADGTTIGLWPLTPANVFVERNRAGEIQYRVNGLTGGTQIFPPSEILHIRGLGWDGLRGYSVIAMARNAIALAAVQERYFSEWFAHGGRRPYHLEHPARFKSQADFERFRAQWMAGYGNADTFHNPPILEGNLKLVEEGFSLRDLEFLESRRFSVEDICRWFRISPHMVGDLSHATFSNIEHLAIEFVQQTLSAWLVRWEQAIRRCLLTQEEKANGVYAKHNIDGLLRGDFASRMSGYATALQNGWLSSDEVRELEDRNPLPNGAGRGYRVQLNMQTLPGTGAPLASEHREEGV